MSKDKSRLDFIQDTKLCVIGGDYFTVIDADTDGPEYRYKKAETVREAIDNAMSEIGVSQGTESHGWIKCSEQLPDDWSEVLFAIKVPESESGCLIRTGSYFEDGMGFCSFDGVEFEGVTHWQPLPKPPID